MALNDGQTPRKRPRTDEGNADASSSSPTPQRVRDSTYYRDDGDCFVLVESTLFKIHKFQLTRDSSAFSDLLTLPVPEGPQQMTETEPLVLHDKVGEFRALCWAVYAAPTEIQDQNDWERVKFDSLISLFIIANKYQFASYEQWSRDLILKHSLPPNNQFLHNGPLARMVQLMKVAQLSDSLEMNTAVQDAWLHRLTNNPAESASQALEVAGAYNLRELQGRIYYQQLLHQRGALIRDSTAYGMAASTLTAEQQNRLYRGFWSLSCQWVALQTHNITNSPPRQDQCPAGHHDTLCGHDWKTAWAMSARRAAENFPPSLFVDPMEQFQSISVTVRNVAESTRQATLYLGLVKLQFPESGGCGARELQRLIEEFPVKLADHFLGPLTV